MGLVQLERRIARWIRSHAIRVWGSFIVTVALPAFAVAGILAIHGAGGKVAAGTGGFFLWGLLLTAIWA